MQNLKQNALLCILIILLDGCGSTTTKAPGRASASPPIPSGPSQNTPQIQQVSFASLQQNIFNPNCVVCHNGSFRSGGVSLASHAEVNASGILTSGNANGSPLFQQVNLGFMPKGRSKLQQADIDSIKNWINQGALNN